MPIYEISEQAITKVPETSFGDHRIRERWDLQRLLRQSIDVVAPDVLVIAEEFGDWDDSRRRIDLLAVDRDGNLVVIELKRSEDGGYMDLQALRYAAMVSTMTFRQAVDAYAVFLRKSDRNEDAQTGILEFLGLDEPTEGTFAKDVRIVLVSGEFSKELTSAVIWLNDRDLDIRCVRLRPYGLDNRVLLDVQQIIPLPEAAEYQVQVRKKAIEQREAKKFNPDFTKYDLTVDGHVYSNLAKRWLVYRTVEAVIRKAVAPEKIAELLPRGMGRWLVTEGECNAETFRSKTSAHPLRWFLADNELFQVNGRTYAFSNQWALDSVPTVDRIMAQYPNFGIQYTKSS